MSENRDFFSASTEYFTTIQGMLKTFPGKYVSISFVEFAHYKLTIRAIKVQCPKSAEMGSLTMNKSM